MDLMGPYMPSTPGRNRYLLVVIDDFTKFVETFTIRDANSVTIGRIIKDKVFTRYGMPAAIASGDGTCQNIVVALDVKF